MIIRPVVAFGEGRRLGNFWTACGAKRWARRNDVRLSMLARRMDSSSRWPWERSPE